MRELPEIVICVPGPWPTSRHIADALGHGDYVLAGDRLIRPAGEGPALQTEEADPQMLRAFRAAGYRRMTDEEVAIVGTHRMVAYLIGAGGTREAVHSMALAATALLDAGGLGVKVESAGLAYAPSRWRELTLSGISVLLQRAFVTYVGDSSETWSCGMQAFGLPDAVVTASNGGAELIRTFTEYVVGESPTILSGQTFSASQDDPSYLLRHERCERYATDDLFHNPYGYWRLIPSS